MQDIQFLESSADILIIIQIRFIRGTEPPNDEGVQKIWNNSLTQQMFVASLIIIWTGCGWARNASPNEWRNAILHMTWKLSSTEMLINEKLVLAVLNSSLVLVDATTTTTTRDHFRVQDMWIRAQRSPCTGQDTWQCLAKDPLVDGGRLPFIIIIVTICFLCRHAMKWWEEWREEKKHSTNWLDTNTW